MCGVWPEYTSLIMTQRVGFFATFHGTKFLWMQRWIVIRCPCVESTNETNILWRVRVAPPIIVGSGSDDWILLAAHITISLNYSNSYSAIAIPHIEQYLHTTIHTESMSRSLHLQLLTPGTLNATVGTHSLHSRLAHWYWLHNYLTDTDWIQLGWFTDIVSERSERTRRKHRLQHLFYCRVTYTS
jgi:hypothetical protein